MAKNDIKGSYTYDYPRPALTTDCVVFGFDGYELKVLLIERGVEPYKGMWAFPGGFMLMDETAEECAARELKEETGLDHPQLKQLGAFSGVGRDPRGRVVTIAFYALARQTEVVGGDDAAHARWFAIDKVPQLAFDHDYILRQAMQKIRRDIHFEPVGFGLLNKRFTIAELQRLYESILGIHFDRRNFYKKILQTGILKGAEATTADATGQKTYGTKGEMRRMNIGALFGSKAKAEAYPQMMSDESLSEASVENGEPEYASHGVGRPGRLYEFNEEGYNRMKENGTFRLEF